MKIYAMILIVTNHFNEDLSWIKDSPYPVIVCSKSGKKYKDHDPNHYSDEKCSTKNKGREVFPFISLNVAFARVMVKKGMPLLNCCVTTGKNILKDLQTQN
jgi:hypothetical protein